MNILYINHYAGSPEMGMEFRPYYLSREWVKMGHHVDIIAGDYSHLRLTNPNVTKDMQKEKIDGIDYYWLKTGSYLGNGVRRALSMIRFCYKLNKWKGWIRSHLKPDVVISSSTYPIDSIPAYCIAHGGGKNKALRYIHEVHDMWPSTLIEIGGMSEFNPFVMLMQYGENFAYKHADALVSLPKYAKDYMVKHGLIEEKFHYIPNGIVKEEWEKPQCLNKEHEAVLAELKQNKKFIVGYFGGHALSNNLQTLLQSAAHMQGETIHFVLVGDGVEKPKLMEMAKNLNNVTFLPPVPKTMIPSLTNYFDCIYIGAKDSPLYRFGICMNKMFDSMMACKPIIFAVNAPPTPVEEFNCGIIVKPENVKAVNEAILRLYQMPVPERNRMAQRGKAAVMEKYTYEILAKEFLKAMC